MILRKWLLKCVCGVGLLAMSGGCCNPSGDLNVSETWIIVDSSHMYREIYIDCFSSVWYFGERGLAVELDIKDSLIGDIYTKFNNRSLNKSDLVRFMNEFTEFVGDTLGVLKLENIVYRISHLSDDNLSLFANEARNRSRKYYGLRDFSEFQDYIEMESDKIWEEGDFDEVKINSRN